MTPATPPITSEVLDYDEVFEKFVQRQTFLGRGQSPEDIAEATVYLCRAENVTGITLTVAGGGEVH